MENASNALIIAGGVLIGVLIISLAVYLFVDFGSTSAEINKKTEQQQLIYYNSKFTSYDDKKDLTIYDAITVAGYAKENNNYYGDSVSDGFDRNYYLNNFKITVTIKINNTTKEIQDYTIEQFNSLIQDEQKNNNELPKYTCSIDYYDNGRVKAVKFK